LYRVIKVLSNLFLNSGIVTRGGAIWVIHVICEQNVSEGVIRSGHLTVKGPLTTFNNARLVEYIKSRDDHGAKNENAVVSLDEVENTRQIKNEPCAGVYSFSWCLIGVWPKGENSI
jgi:hypothetical protein